MSEVHSIEDRWGLVPLDYDAGFQYLRRWHAVARYEGNRQDYPFHDQRYPQPYFSLHPR
jgi:hypothetical protein